jgi:hypothetical protein
MKSTSRKASCRASFAARLGILTAIAGMMVVPAALGQQYSSSADYHKQIETLIQYPSGNQSGYPSQSYNRPALGFNRFAFEVGGGFNAPAGYFSNIATWGGNFTVGGGWNFSKSLGALLEFQYLDNKVGGHYLRTVAGTPGGNVQNWAITAEPVWNYKTKGNFGGYVIGGGGFYRRLTSFTVPGVGFGCYYYFCGLQSVNVVVAHYSSNQGGLNLGTGMTFKAFGPDADAKLFMEARYVWVDSPKTNVFHIPDSTESMFPVTIGIRW